VSINIGRYSAFVGMARWYRQRASIAFEHERFERTHAFPRGRQGPSAVASHISTSAIGTVDAIDAHCPTPKNRLINVGGIARPECPHASTLART
jgi:hypothetical protein